MDRRNFLASSLAASAMTLASGTSEAVGQASGGKAREYYELRKYYLRSGPQGKLTDTYVGDVLIPALNRMGIAPVGAFRLEYGPETPTLYLLLPCSNVETLVTAELKLAQDAAFLKAAEPFWNAPAITPAFVRAESSLHIAFEGWPKLVLPPATATNAKRIFHLRTYESPSNYDHVRKVEMFHSGEFDIFAKAGAKQVFYGDTLIGTRTPSLTYMLSFADMNELNTVWDAFRAAPEWKKLAASPRFSFEAIVSDVSNLVLSPAPYSQI
ncbi:NIPSNAP family protein [Granulicella sp. dw_53]|uniref:NIPSNAP family protein n=1 Tax=Granulicella sp. dw_53 TaxID=2719792 RepID=UPI001BD4B52B|nr:NIPSNAP family protein [Granulicella sp. dw_53]